MSSPEPASDVSGVPFSNFAEAAQAVLSGLRDRVGLSLWLVTRAGGEDQIVLRADAREGAALTEGTVLSWSGSLCTQMVAGNGPTVAPRVADVPAYAGAANRQAHGHRGVRGGAAAPRRRGDLRQPLWFRPRAAVRRAARGPTEHQLAGGCWRPCSTWARSRRLLRRANGPRSTPPSMSYRPVQPAGVEPAAWSLRKPRCRRYGHPACVVVVEIDGRGGQRRAGARRRGRAVAPAHEPWQATRGTSIWWPGWAVTSSQSWPWRPTEAGGLRKAAILRTVLAEGGVLAAIGVAARPGRRARSRMLGIQADVAM